MGDYEDRGGARVHRLANLAGNVTLGVGTRVDAFVTITGNVKIGRFCHISTGACIFGGAGFSMGDYSGLSAGVKVFTATEDVSGDSMMNPCAPEKYRAPIIAPIRVGDHCVVGANSVLLPGADLPDGAVVGALSLVKAQLSAWAIYAGVPARFIKSRSNNVLLLQDQLEKESKCPSSQS